MRAAAGFGMAVALVLCGGVLAWYAQNRQPSSRSPIASVAPASALDDGQPVLSDFTLVDQNGVSMASGELAGRVWAGSFFFAQCPSICYNQNIKLQQLDAQFAADGLVLVSITCDPDNDTPEALLEYASRFHADAASWRFLTSPTADMDYIRRIGKDFFQLTVDQEFHSDRVVVFDRDGTLRGSFHVLRPDEFQECQRILENLLGNDA